MPGDPSRDRTFQSREIIWNTFEAMAREQGVPIDELVNEAMAAYARVRGYTVPQAPPPPPAPIPQRGGFPQPRIVDMETHDNLLEETHDGGIAMSPLDCSYSPARAPDDEDDDDSARTSTRHQAYARPGARAPERERPEPMFAPPPQRGKPAPAALNRMPGPASARGESQGRSPMPAAGPPPLPVPQRMMPPTTMPMSGGGAARGDLGMGTQRRLVLTYQGRQYVVDKDRYLIGRSKTQSDLRLDDPNVSRQHAVIERVGSAWYIVDLGSTNGVLIGTERIARRAVADGDVIIITSHEIRCALR